MKKSLTKCKLTIIISFMSISLVSIAALAGCAPADSVTNPLPSSDTSSILASSESAVSAPEIPLKTPTSDSTTSSVPSITVDGSPSSVVSAPSKATSNAQAKDKLSNGAASSKPNTATSSKPPSSTAASSVTSSDTSTSSKASSTPSASSEPPASQPPPIASNPTNDVNNPVDGTTKVDENGDTWTFIEGKWWNDGPMNQQMVDDSSRVLDNCEDCGNIPTKCTCVVGY